MSAKEVTIKIETIDKKKKRGCCGVLVLVFFIVIIAGAIISQPTKDTKSPNKEVTAKDKPQESVTHVARQQKDSSTPETVSVPAKTSDSEKMSSTDVVSSKGAVPESAKKIEASDKGEMELLQEKYEKEIRDQLPFTEPKVGEYVKFRIDDGKIIEGKIYRLTKQNICLGSDDVQMTLKWDRLVPYDRMRFDRTFYEEYIKSQAREQAKIKKESLEREEKRKELEAIRLREKRAQERRIQSNASKFGRNFESYDGSIRPVVAAVKATMHDPDSFEHVKTQWYILTGTKDQYLVKMWFRGKNKLGGKVLNQIQAVCGIDGNIISIESGE